MKYILPLFIALLTVACNAPQNEKNTSTNRITFKNKIWKKEDLKTFKVKIDSEKSPHYMSIVMKSDANYPYPLMQLRIQEKQPNGEMLAYNFELNMQTKEEDFEEIQKRGGKSHLVIPSIVYNASGEYTFTIAHGMPEQTLPGVQNMELIVKPINVPNP